MGALARSWTLQIDAQRVCALPTPQTECNRWARRFHRVIGEIARRATYGSLSPHKCAGALDMSDFVLDVADLATAKRSNNAFRASLLVRAMVCVLLLAG